MAWRDCRDFARAHIIRAFLESIEFQNKFNLTPGSDNADMILALYRHGLGREPNAAPLGQPHLCGGRVARFPIPLCSPHILRPAFCLG